MPIDLALPWGRFWTTNNELNVESTVDDPGGFSMYAPGTGSYGKISWKRRMPNGRTEEVVCIQGKMDERARDAGGDLLSGEFTIHVRNGNVDDADGGMIKVLEARHDGIFILGLKVAPNVSASNGGSNLRSPQGRMSMELQEDGNLVVYDTSTTPWTPKWSIWTGPI